MNIKEDMTIQSVFNCSHYPDLYTSTYDKNIPQKIHGITYKVCLMRQLARTPGQGWLYRECVECVEGKDVFKRFKDYKPEKKLNPNWNTKGCAQNEKRKSKTMAIVDCVKCKTLLHGQIEYAIQLIYSEKQKVAVKTLEMLLKEI